jgi:galactokinase
MQDTLQIRFRESFGRDPEFIARAPGRIEFIGNHTDYNGGTVLGAAIDRCVWVGLARRDDGRRRYASDGRGEVVENPGPAPVKASRQSWVNYPLGMLTALASSGVSVPAGFDYLAVSNVPAGAGLSSSAAIELASGLAFLAAAGAELPRETLVALGRKAENEFVGVPCGILDQGVSGFGRRDHLVHIDCRGPRFSTVPIPAGCAFWIFNTHTKHALVDGLYASRHAECMEAARVMGVPALVDASAEALAAAETRLSRVSFKRARHVIEEIARVDQATKALSRGDLAAVGRLLLASHRSSRTWFENSTPELDFLVDSLEGVKGVHGARLTGGGFGGAVMALTSADFNAASAAAVCETYLAKFGNRPEVIEARTEDGAALLRRP